MPFDILYARRLFRRSGSQTRGPLREPLHRPRLSQAPHRRWPKTRCCSGKHGPMRDAVGHSPVLKLPPHRSRSPPPATPALDRKISVGDSRVTAGNWNRLPPTGRKRRTYRRFMGGAQVTAPRPGRELRMPLRPRNASGPSIRTPRPSELKLTSVALSRRGASCSGALTPASVVFRGSGGVRSARAAARGRSGVQPPSKNHAYPSATAQDPSTVRAPISAIASNTDALISILPR